MMPGLGPATRRVLAALGVSVVQCRIQGPSVLTPDTLGLESLIVKEGNAGLSTRVITPKICPQSGSDARQ